MDLRSSWTYPGAINPASASRSLALNAARQWFHEPGRRVLRQRGPWTGRCRNPELVDSRECSGEVVGREDLDEIDQPRVDAEHPADLTLVFATELGGPALLAHDQCRTSDDVHGAVDPAIVGHRRSPRPRGLDEVVGVAVTEHLEVPAIDDHEAGRGSDCIRSKSPRSMAAPNAAHGTRTGRWAAPSPATYRWSSSASAAGRSSASKTTLLISRWSSSSSTTASSAVSSPASVRA